MTKTLVILSQYKAVPQGDLWCRGCAFDNDVPCPEADCEGIIWEKISADEEVLEG